MRVRNKFIFTALFLILSVGSNSGLANTSSMTGMRINQCFKQNCFRAQAPKGFVSLADYSIAAENVELSIYINSSTTVYNCASFRYSPRAQYLSCDNQANHEASLTIDRQLKIKTYKYL